MLRKSLFALLLVVMNIGLAEAVVSKDIRRETERATSLIEHGRYTEARHSFTLLRKRVPMDDEVLVRYIDYELVRCAAELREVGGQAVLGRQIGNSTPWLTERHGYDPTSAA